MKLDKYLKAAIAATAFTVLLNIVSYFFLPAKINTIVDFSGAASRSTLTYLFLSALLVLLLAGMVFFSVKFQPKKKTKWFVGNLVVTLLNVIIIVYNLTIK